MKKFYKHLALLLIALLLAGCTQGSGAREPGKYFVQNIIDGDTAELADGSKVRYIGIDTPETMKRAGSSWMFAPEAFGLAAKDHNRELVMQKEVRLEFDVEKRDKYGRLLAYVYIDEEMVNLDLVRAGYATVYTFPPNVKYYDSFLKAQKEARDAKRGIWGAMKEISPQEASESTGKFRIVKGTVQNVGLSKGAIYLSFGSDRSKSLTAVIFTRNIPLFSKEGIEPASDFEGKFVEVIGKIEDKSGPQMIIDNPTQIKILRE